MKLSRYLFALMVCLGGLSLATTVHASNEKYVDFITGDLTGRQLVVTDQRYNEMNLGDFDFRNDKVEGLVVLSVDPSSKTYQSAEYTATVVVAGTYYTYDGTKFVTHNISTSLQVSYTTDGTVFTDKAVLRLPGAHMIKLNVVSSTINPAGAKANLKLSTEINIDRRYSLDLNTLPSGLTCINLLVQSGEVEFVWAPVTNAEEYDLEWVYVNDYGTDGTSITADKLDVEENIFKNNSTRVTVLGNRYKIPYIYDRGYILYRVRAVGYSKLNNYAGRMEGRWSFDPLASACSTVACFPHKFHSGSYAHQNNLNWQFTASYAEEGKSKVVLNYFDGIFRDRQSVTRINSLDKSLVGEKIYDSQSRPAIQVLPVPVEDNRLDYRQMFNLNLDGTKPYSSEQFDIDQSGCMSYPAPMSNLSGASRYYSPMNPKKTGHNAYIPDAQGYPFIQTEYTPDNTGRVKTTSMPGPVHQLQDNITKPEHVTRNYYGTPNKEDLDALFGPEAGDASHYKKNMIKDPNGQMSISYIDPAGHTIATSLTGNSPDNLLALTTNGNNVVTVDVLNKKSSTENKGSSNFLNLEEMTIVAEKKITLSSEQKPTFAYEMQGQTYTNNCSNTITLPDGTEVTKTDERCFNCVYDIALSLTDICGNEYITDLKNSINYPTVIGQNILTAIDNNQPVNCTTQSMPTYDKSDIKIDQNLKPGEYSLRKMLKVNQKALDYFTDQYFANNNCLLDLDYFKQNEYLSIDFSGCLTCEDCKKLTGNYDQYNVLKNPDCEPCLTQEQYNAVIGQCENLCENDKSTKCQGAYYAMLSDVSPGGQYGEYQESGKMVDGVMTQGDNEKYEPEKFPLSVFNQNNLLPKKTSLWKPNWRNPYGGLYKDDDGTVSLVQVVRLSDTEFEPKVVDPALVDANDMTVPTNLADVKDFIVNWKPSWANSLVNYHPEYSLYELCGGLQASHDFDYDWLNKDFQYTTDIPSAWKTTLANFKFEDFDPFFTTIPSALRPVFVKMMHKALNKYTVSKDGTKILSIWQVMWLTSHSSEDMCSTLTIPDDPAISSVNEWNIFKALYNSVKMKFVQKYITYYSIRGGYYNGCIGDKKFSPVKDGFLYAKFTTGGISWLPRLFRVSKSQFFNYMQPCNYARYNYYREKEPRFESYQDVLQFEFLKNSECDVSIDVEGITDDGVSMEEHICNQDQDKALQESENITDLAIYKMCGQCPSGRDIQELLKALVKNGDFLSAEKLISCTYPELTVDLKETIGANANDNVYWKKILYNRGSSLEAKLFNTKFYFKLPANSLYDFADIQKLCCLSYQPNPTLFVLSNDEMDNGFFTITATVKIKPGDEDYDSEFPSRTKEIFIEGHSGIDIKNCTFQPVCTPTQEALDVMGLLNALALNVPEISSPKLTSTTPVRLTVDESGLPEASILYSGALTERMRTILDANISPSLNNINWHWVASVSGSTLTARIQDGITPSVGKCEIMLYGLPSGLTFDDISSFTNIKPYTGEQDYDFTITAIIEKNNTRQYVILNGDIAYFNMGSCDTVLPDEWDPAGGKSNKANTGYYFCKESETAKNILDYLNRSSNNWAQHTDKEYVLVDIPSLATKVELWMPPLSENYFHEVKSFTNIEPDQVRLGDNTSTKYFVLSALKTDGTKVQVNGYCKDFSMGNCFPTVNTDCPANDAVNVIMDQLNIKAGAGLISGNHVGITYGNIADVDVTINFTTPGVNYSGIRSFSHIIPKTDDLDVNGFSTQFYVIAHMANGEILQMEGWVPKGLEIYTSICGKKATSNGGGAELVVNGDFEDQVTLTGYPDKICTGYCAPSTELMNALHFKTELNYKYTWGNQAGGGSDNYGTFRVGAKMAGYSPSYSGNGLFVDGKAIKTSRDYTIVWLQEIDVLPGKDYNFSCMFSNLQEHGPARLDVVIFNPDMAGYTSILPGASIREGNEKPYINTSSEKGINIRLAMRDNKRVWYKVKQRINALSSSRIILAVIDYSFDGKGNDFIVDNISLREPGFVANQDIGYDENNNFMCNLPDFNGSLTPPEENIIKETSCFGNLKNIALHNAKVKYEIYKEEQRVNFREEYIKKCLDVYEKLLMTYTDGENHYTLYYYDQAGNLIRTVPPAGVNKLPAEKLEQVNTDRQSNTQTVFTDHTLVSTYKYNSLNQLVAQSSPDMEDLNIKETGLSNTGIPSGYDIRGMAFSDPVNGYAIANEGSNGHFYKTTDGGKTWSEITGMGVGDILTVKHISSDVVFAIGERGLIMKSVDGGDSWSQKTINSQGALTGIYFSSASNGIIVEQNGRLWITQDAGETWGAASDKLFRKISGTVKDIYFTDANTGFVVASTGRIYKTTDGGINWEAVSAVRANNLADVSYSEGVAFAGGENGTILKRILGGNWEKLQSVFTGNIKKINVASSNRISVVAQDKTLWYTDDPGKTWTQKLSNIESFNFSDDLKGLAFASGTLYRTSDGGKTWNTVPGSPSVPVVTGFYADGTKLYITGPGKTLYRSINNGSTWESVNATQLDATIKAFYVKEPYAYTLTSSGTLWSSQSISTPDALWIKVTTGVEENKDLTAMDWSDGQTGVVVKSSGKILATADGGVNWTIKELTGIAGALQSVTMNSKDNATVVGSLGESWTTTNGADWSNESPKVLLPSVNSITCIGSNQCYTAGNNGTILKTSDGGVSWNLQNSGTAQNINAISFYNNQRGMAVGENGTILDYNGTWSVVTTAVTKHLFDVVNTGSGTGEGMAVGAQNTVAGGSSWTLKNIPSSIENLTTISFNPGDEEEMIAAGQKGKLYKSSNGQDWTLVNSQAPAIMNATQLVNLVTGYAVGNGGEVYRTTDAGASWKRIGSAGNTDLKGLYFTDLNHGIVIGNVGAAYITTNGGTSWSAANISTSANLTSVTFANSKDGFMTGENGTFLVTNTGMAGQWTAGVLTPAVTGTLNKVWFVNPLTGFLVGASGVIYSTTDGGTTWKPKGQGVTTEELVDVYFSDTKNGYVVTKAGTLFKTINGGQSWENKNAPASDNTHILAAADGNNLFIAGSNGNVVKVTDNTDMYSSQFYYDRLGRLVASQNAKQYNSNHNKYSYTIYDEQNRIVEVGEVVAPAPVTTHYDEGLMNHNRFMQWIALGTRSEVTHTYYDVPLNDVINGKFGAEGQQNLRSRVATITYEDNFDNDPATYNAASHYSYDVHGNVKKLVQDNPRLAAYNNQDVVIEYEYDLISNKVNLVKYQEGKPDQFFHKYVYDSDNRITNVFTSRDNAIWDEDAAYTYYDHGPLARVDLGDNKVQGVDYAYTIQGWLKGINSNTLTPGRDMGKDGAPGAGNLHANVPQDLFGYTLGYYSGDYKAINASATNLFEASTATAGFVADPKYNLYNGNIGHTVSAIGEFMKGAGASPQAMAYQYDQLNRLINAREFKDGAVMSSNTWNAAGATGSYSMDLSYDANGNIKTLQRKAAGGALMDNLTYRYETLANGYLKNTNKLRSVSDTEADAFGGIQPGQDNNNYEYDEIGNLVKNKQDSIENIEWTISGKIKRIERLAICKYMPDLEYSYDVAGNRTMKVVKPRANGVLLPSSSWAYTFYTRDAQGNVMSTYELPEGGTALKVRDITLYGSSRLGILNVDNTLTNLALTDQYSLKTGEKNYELANHLGNVMVTFTDIRKPKDMNSDGITDTYEATLVSASDYYPFGMLMPGRSSYPTRYQFGLQGQEKDDEISEVSGTHYAFKYRVYDARIGRFYTVDPLSSKYPYNSTYAFAENKVGSGIELEGLELLDNGTSMFKMYGSGGEQTGTGPTNTTPISNEIGLVNDNVPKVLKDNNGKPKFTPLGLNMGTDGQYISLNGPVYKDASKSYNNIENPEWNWSISAEPRGYDLGVTPVWNDRHKFWYTSEAEFNDPASALAAAPAEAIAWITLPKNIKTWNAITKVNNQADMFLKATRMVDNYIDFMTQNNGHPLLRTGFMRAAMINFVTDGTLSAPWNGNIYNYANGNLPIIYYGMHALKTFNILKESTQKNVDFILQVVEMPKEVKK